MKPFCSLLATVILCSSSASAATVSDTDRQALLDHLYKTRQLLADTLRGLTPAQAKFKPSDEQWSILECAEHLTEAEPFLFTRAMKGLEQPSGKPSATSDDNILKGWGTVVSKVKAPPTLTPTGRWATPSDALREFDQRRAKSIQFVAETSADLRGTGCCGGMDVYQQLLGMSAHVTRHVTQMNEVKADPKYPKQ